MTKYSPVDFNGEVHLVRTPKGDLHVLLNPDSDRDFDGNRAIKLSPRPLSESEKRISRQLLYGQLRQCTELDFGSHGVGYVNYAYDDTVLIDFAARGAGKTFKVKVTLSVGDRLKYVVEFEQSQEKEYNVLPLGSGDLDRLIELAALDMIKALRQNVSELERLELVAAPKVETSQVSESAEIDRLRTLVGQYEADLDAALEQREHAEEMADKLAAALAGKRWIGEHTSENDPWQNALDLAKAGPAAEA